MDNQPVKRRKINGIIQNCLIQNKKEEKRGIIKHLEKIKLKNN